MKIYIPSFNRPRCVFALEVFPTATVIVPESQRAEYEYCNPGATLAVIPDAQDGNLARKRKAVAALGKNQPEGAFIVVDDDVCGLWDKQEERQPSAEEALAMLETLAQRAAAEGAAMFGVGTSRRPLREDAAQWRENVMFFQIYGFRGNLVPAFDESISGFESTDLFFQCRERGLKTLRWERYGVEVIKGNLGGLDRMKTKCLEASEALARKWGPRVVTLTPDGLICGLNVNGVKPLA